MAAAAAVGMQTRCAGKVQLQDIFNVPIGSGPAWFSGTEHGYQGDSQCGGYVHGACVIGDHQCTES